MSTNTSDIPSPYTVASLGAFSRARLEPRFGKGEAAAMVREIWRWLKGWDITALALNADKPASVFIADQFDKTVYRLLDGEPLQYITGEAYFYGMDFLVNSSTLIPRPETAELVDMIVKQYSRQTDLRVLDIGTGSGCIAIALARNLPFSHVTAIDISSDALAIARENALRLKARIDFAEADILSIKSTNQPLYDIIVSNPPYIAISERAGMDPMVADREPAGALFVPDSDPLKFYRAVLIYASDALADSGSVFFEINPLFADQLRSLADAQGCWKEIDITRDIHGKQRFMSARRVTRH